mmetsp:Transcript_3759/g.9111  ORF Transcript_3759/g.9111 Transcript_3759/m.9111 type:complete len:130 (-) Transcript_3759:1695-2084(-)
MVGYSKGRAPVGTAQRSSRGKLGLLQLVCGALPFARRAYATRPAQAQKLSGATEVSADAALTQFLAPRSGEGREQGVRDEGQGVGDSKNLDAQDCGAADTLGDEYPTLYLRESALRATPRAVVRPVSCR